MTTHVTFDLGENPPPDAHFISGSGHEDFVSVYLTPNAHAFAHTRAQCDAAIKAFLAARDLLPPDPAPPATDPGPPLPEVACGADWGSATTSQRCVLPEGHDSNHIDAAGHAWGIPCAHVNGDGSVSPASAR